MSVSLMTIEPALGLQQPDQGLQEDRLAGAGRAEHHGDLAGRQGEGDVAPDVLAAEGLGQPLDLHLDAHAVPPPLRLLAGARRRSDLVDTYDGNDDGPRQVTYVTPVTVTRSSGRRSGSGRDASSPSTG